jgi:hypothetical protein
VKIRGITLFFTKEEGHSWRADMPTGSSVNIAIGMKTLHFSISGRDEEPDIIPDVPPNFENRKRNQMRGVNEFTRIKGLSNIRRIPRLGHIRLGVKAISAQGKAYPVEKHYFLLPPEAAKIYGQQAEELDVMFVVEDEQVIFPQRLAWFGQSRGPKCMGDGEKARRLNDKGEYEDRSCPCDLRKKKECLQRGSLFVMLPKVSVAGVYQIDISSYHSIVDLNSGIDYIRALLGRISMVPLKLKRVARETHGSGRKETHYPLQIAFEGNMDALMAFKKIAPRQIGAPPEIPPGEISNPELDHDGTEERAEPGMKICPERGEVADAICESCNLKAGCPAWE